MWMQESSNKMSRGFLGMLLLVLLSGSSCKKETPLTAERECKELNMGTVLVSNNTGNEAWIDLVWGEIEENDPVKLQDGKDTLFTDVPAGSVSVRLSLDLNQWYSELQNLRACQDLEYTWYLDRKSAHNE